MDSSLTKAPRATIPPGEPSRLATGPSGRHGARRLLGERHSEKALRRAGFLFVLPFAAYVLVWICIPAGYGLWISLTNDSLLSAPSFVGLANYGALLGSSPFWASVRLTGEYMVWVVPITLVVSFVGAYSISRVKRGGALFSTLFFIPYIIPAVATAIVFELLLQQGGLIDQVFHVHIAWLTTPGDSMIALGLTTAWSLMGFYVLVFFAGLRSLSRDALEAAMIDGCGTWQRLWRVELPLLRPTILFACVTSVAYVATNFTTVFVLTQGGPGNATEILPIYIYQNAFEFSQAGLASAAAMMMLAAGLVVVGIQFWLFGRLDKP
jgi:multiple sugar transport system permease protein